jgi:hypothetical protein
MKTIGLLIAAFVLHAPALAAQPAAPMDPRLVVAQAERPAAPAPAVVRRDHWQGAWDGLVLGAAVGGLGFAATTYFGNMGDSEGQDYWMLALPVGAIVGGGVGLVAGAIIGAPDRDRDREPENRAQVVVLPGRDRGIAAALSVPVGSPSP